MRSKIKKSFLIIIGGIRADIVKSVLKTLHNDLVHGGVVLFGRAFKPFDNINGNTEGLIYGLIRFPQPQMMSLTLSSARVNKIKGE